MEDYTNKYNVRAVMRVCGLGNERVIYLGNGEWQPLANTSHPGEAADQSGRGQPDADRPISS